MQQYILLKSSIEKFAEFLKEHEIRRFYFVYDGKSDSVLSSHKELEPIAEFLQNDKRDFKTHEGLFFQLNGKYDSIYGAFVHRTNRGQGAGGLRYWHYDTVEDFLRDGLRLSMGMTHKNALAGLWWGGGKGIMTYNPAVKKNDPQIREYLYKEYGEFITSLRGCYVTAEDVGSHVTDMANVFSKTRFITCIPAELGGSGNPSVPTARGVIAGIEAAFEYIGTKMEGKTAAVQGLGNVGLPVVKFLFEKKIGKVIGCDIFPEIVEKAKEEMAGKNVEFYLVDKTDRSIFSAECDVLSPNATGAIINSFTIPEIKAKIICGAANNQLEDPVKDDIAVFEKGIIYVPDFLTNRMGIVNCADEHAGYVNNDPFIERHLQKDWEYSVYKTTLKVLTKSRQNNKPTGAIAVELAEKLSLIDNPIYRAPRAD